MKFTKNEKQKIPEIKLSIHNVGVFYSHFELKSPFHCTKNEVFIKDFFS